ncbi:MAG: alkaline phosphatase [Marinagarivorans sp.]
MNKLLHASVLMCAGVAASANAAPVVSRLTPPSQLFASQGAEAGPIIARFIPGQRFDLQATVSPDAGKTITSVQFFVDGNPVSGSVALTGGSALNAGLPPETKVASLRAYTNATPGIHNLSVKVTQSDNQQTTATGNFEIVGINANAGRKAKNIIIMLGDGMGASHRTAARIMLNGYAQGKTKERLAMDTFPNTAMIMTASLNSIITDSAPGMSNYVTGNKAQNNQEGVWPDDTKDAFDNPRFEYLSEFLARTQGKKLGIVTTADVFDATPAANAVHTSNRGAGTGIVDQFFDDASKSGLTVLLGGGRKWFLPNGTPGSARAASSDYSLPADIISGWGAAPGAVDPARNLIAEMQNSGWTYASDLTSLNAAGTPNKLLGLFAYSNMNVALDKIAGRRGNGAVVNDFGFPNQPMLDEMTQKALDVLDANSPNGFVLMVEAASIDKQAHNMDSDRFIVEAIEFDYAIKKAKDYAATHPDTLVLVTADHECAGVAIIGASTKTDADLAASPNTVAGKRDAVVGVYDAAGFPKYTKAADGYPASTDPDYKMLIGYASNVDRYEDWRTNAQPLRDSQQPFNNSAPLNTYPADPLARDASTGFLITGQIPQSSAVAAHTGGDIPLSALGRGASLFGGVMDNTEVFFSIMQAAVGGAK